MWSPPETGIRDTTGSTFECPLKGESPADCGDQEGPPDVGREGLHRCSHGNLCEWSPGAVWYTAGAAVCGALVARQSKEGMMKHSTK